VFGYASLVKHSFVILAAVGVPWCVQARTRGDEALAALIRHNVVTRAEIQMPAASVTRGRFAAMLVRANNECWKQTSHRLIALSRIGPPAFEDVQPQSKYFGFVNGLVQYGDDIGFGSKEYHPNRRMRTVDALAIKALVDRGKAMPRSISAHCLTIVHSRGLMTINVMNSEMEAICSDIRLDEFARRTRKPILGNLERLAVQHRISQYLDMAAAARLVVIQGSHEDVGSMSAVPQEVCRLR